MIATNTPAKSSNHFCLESLINAKLNLSNIKKPKIGNTNLDHSNSTKLVSEEDAKIQMPVIKLF